MKLNIEIIPHHEQRYETVGDWWLDREGVLQVRISRLSMHRYEILVLIHELVEIFIEWHRRTQRGLDDTKSLLELTSETDEFDILYEKRRKRGDKESEPGCETECPVYNGHMAASAIEHVAALIFGINYNDYANEIANLHR
jgi:hypothetical protein